MKNYSHFLNEVAEMRRLQQKVKTNYSPVVYAKMIASQKKVDDYISKFFEGEKSIMQELHEITKRVEQVPLSLF